MPTDHYRTFVETWARHCGAPKSVFVGQLDVTIAAEVAAATGPLQTEIEQVAAHWQEKLSEATETIAETGARLNKANGRVTAVERERDEWGGKASTAPAEASAFRRQRDEAVKALGDLLDAVYVVTNADPTHYEVANAVGGPALAARQLIDLYRRVAILRSEPVVPDWVLVHIGEMPGQNTFASCYLCGALCQPEPWTYGQAERVALVEAFRDEHAACPPRPIEVAP